MYFVVQLFNSRIVKSQRQIIFTSIINNLVTNNGLKGPCTSLAVTERSTERPQ